MFINFGFLWESNYTNFPFNSKVNNVELFIQLKNKMRTANYENTRQK